MSLSELLALHGELGPVFYILLGNTLELEIKAFEDISILRIYRGVEVIRTMKKGKTRPDNPRSGYTDTPVWTHSC